MFAIRFSASQGPSFSDVWGSDQQDALSEMAAEFKKTDDLVGLYLCALVEEQLKCTEKRQRNCPIEAQFFLALALSYKAGALHKLVHVVYPAIGEMFATAAAVRTARQEEGQE